MSAYKVAKAVMAQGVEQALAEGYDEQAFARAMMTEVIAVYRRARSMDDIASELKFQADNLDEDQEYAFMRP
ncbi:MAG: hypothetical protein V7681_04180 [Halopseudomonas sabulinigri]|tara:strand:- start:2697 stop:2912 length:216 start_codon:yes stop_codon:yes gene_type:complete